MQGTLTSIETIAAAFPLVAPLRDMRITQKFGENAVSFYKDLGLKGHDALDLVAPMKTPLYSCMNGTVGYAYTGDRDNYGYLVFLRTPTKTIGTIRCFVEAIYAHMDTVAVETGQEVTEGQQIGTADNTGRYTTGSHLHWGTRVVYLVDGKEVRQRDNGYFGYSDPMLFLTKGTKLEQFPVDRRYGKPRQYLAEKAFAFNPVTRRALGRLPTAREINCIVYGGGWTLQHLVEPAMFITWAELTYDEYRAKLRAMTGS